MGLPIPYFALQKFVKFLNSFKIIPIPYLKKYFKIPLDSEKKLPHDMELPIPFNFLKFP